MIAQGAWRRMFNEIKATKPLANALNDVFRETETGKKSGGDRQLYALNKDAEII